MGLAGGPLLTRPLALTTPRKVLRRTWGSWSCARSELADPSQQLGKAHVGRSVKAQAPQEPTRILMF